MPTGFSLVSYHWVYIAQIVTIVLAVLALGVFIFLARKNRTELGNETRRKLAGMAVLGALIAWFVVGAFECHTALRMATNDYHVTGTISEVEKLSDVKGSGVTNSEYVVFRMDEFDQSVVFVTHDQSFLKKNGKKVSVRCNMTKETSKVYAASNCVNYSNGFNWPIEG